MSDASWAVGISVTGDSNVVRDCIVYDTGGALSLGAPVSGIGILMQGSAQVLPPRSTTMASQAIGNVVLGTRSMGRRIAAVGMSFARGPFMVVGNRVGGDGTGTGIAMDASDGFRDNIVTRAATPTVGGANLGNNAVF